MVETHLNVEKIIVEKQIDIIGMDYGDGVNY